MPNASARRALAHALESRRLMAINTLSPAADSYVRDGSFAGQNFGSATELHMKLSGPGFQREGLMRFDLAAVGANVASAKLRVFGALQDNRSSNVLTDVYGTAATWSESGVTWNNRPGPTTAKLATITILDTTQRLYEVDVTAYVQGLKTAGQTAVSFLYRNPATAGPYSFFKSRETSTSNKPTLVVDSNTGGPVLPVVAVAATDATASEPGSNTGTFTFTRSGSTASALTAGYAVGGTASAGSDYTALSGTVTFAAGSSTATVTVSPVDNGTPEPTESVIVTLSSNAAYTIDGGNASATVNIADNDTPSGQTPFGGVAATVPGAIQAERFDEGGEGVAYHDADAAQQGGAFRTNVGVDVETTTDGGSGNFAIGHIKAGEWVEFTVNVTTAGSYDLTARFASGSGGGNAHLEVDGANVSGAISLPGTGGWQNWTNVVKQGINLPAGSHVLRFMFDSSAQGGDIGNLNWIALNPAAPAAQPPRWPSSWQTAASAPTARFEAAGAVVGNKIFVFGGFLSNFNVHRTYMSYNAANNTWTNLGTMPVDMAESHQELAVDGQFIYIAGGFGGNLNTSQNPTQWISNKVWRYDTVANTFTQITTLPQPRGAGGLDLIGRNLHYFGGNPADRITNVADHWVYNLDTGVWSTAAPMPNPKDHFSSLVLNGKIYALGGEHGHDQLHEQQSDMWMYDPATDAWTQRASMPIFKSHMESGTFVLDGKIVMAGGQTHSFQPTSNVVAYDPNTNSWATLAPLPAPRQGAIVHPIGNAIYITLGGTQTNSPQSNTWVGQLPAV
jgi:N-acetylneuraminic acid mutarotase